MRTGDVWQIDLPDDAHAGIVRTRARALEVLDVEDDHVAPVAAVALEVATGRCLRAHRRDDLEERVPQREHRVRQPELSHPRIAKRLPEPKCRAERGGDRLELARHQHGLAQTYPGSIHSDANPSREI